MISESLEVPKEKSIVIRIDLKHEIEIARFNKIKNEMATKRKISFESVSNSDTIRETLKLAVENITENNVIIGDEFVEEIKRLIHSPNFRKKYAITNFEQFVTSALSQFLNHIDKSRKSIKTELFEVLSELDGFERQVVMTILALHEQKPTSPYITIATLEQQLKLENTDLERLKKALKRLKDDNYIDMAVYNGQEFYWPV